MKNLSTKLNAQLEEIEKLEADLGKEMSERSTIRHIIFWLVIIAGSVALYAWAR